MRAVLLLVASLQAASTQILPPPTIQENEDGLVDLPSFYVRDFRFHGNTVFTHGDLWMVVADYVRRPVNSADLEHARQALTMHYINHGYINSGVVLEDQNITNGIIHFTVLEGRLSSVQVDGNRRLSERYIRGRIQRYSPLPLNLHALQESLQLLRQSPNIGQVNAELNPGPLPGSGVLRVTVSEANPWQAGLVLRNDRPPSVGAETLEVVGAHGNLLGFGDELALRYAILRRDAHGAHFPDFDDWGISYNLPITAQDTAVQFFFDQNDVSIIEEPFSNLDVSSETVHYGATLRHPVHRSLHREIVLGLTLERTRTRTFLLGEPFSLSPGAEAGESTVTVLRFFQEWVERDHQKVLALRSSFSWGLDWLHPTKQDSEPDGLFVTWLGQAQFIRRFGDSQHQLVLNSTLQWANQPLLGLEQLSLGGASTVRGYRENQLVRDMGWLASAEVRLAVWLSGRGDALLQIAPFLDFGLGWNARGPNPDPSHLTSAGLGLVFTPHRKFTARLDWGYGFRQFDSHNDLQDYGLHFRLSAFVF